MSEEAYIQQENSVGHLSSWQEEEEQHQQR
jgi:hypothetical protein